MDKLRFAIIGTGFWANYQIPAWTELDGVELVALYNRTKAKAEALADKYEISHVYDNLETLLENERLDFVDIITDVDTHAKFTLMAASKGIAVICQKPMAATLEESKMMMKACASNNVPFFIHENWRWQTPIRKVKSLLSENRIGKIFKARVTFCSNFPVWENQPFLAQLEQFILTDIGSHILDVCRFLFGEAESLYCVTSRVNAVLKGEDAAQLLMKMRSGVSCYTEISYASKLEYQSFPETFILVEGEAGTIHLTRDCEIRITTGTTTTCVKAEPKIYDWADPAYALVHSSIVDCNRNILHALQGKSQAETSGQDNYETVRLVQAAYASAASNEIVRLDSF